MAKSNKEVSNSEIENIQEIVQPIDQNSSEITSESFVNSTQTNEPINTETTTEQPIVSPIVEEVEIQSFEQEIKETEPEFEISDDKFYFILGKTVEESEVLVDMEGHQLRVIEDEIDDSFNPGRVNVKVSQGLISKLLGIF